MSASERDDPAAEQLTEYQKAQQEKNKDNIFYSTSNSGIDLVHKDSSITVGRYGPIVLIDHNLTQQLGHFNRERIPERVVHAKGAGAFGYFEVTHDITKYTIAKLFSKVGKRTDIAARFSQVAGNAGSADTVRDPRGFALKFYTEDGIWDLVGNNTPIFFMRDPILFPMFIHSQKRNPVTNLRDWDMFWDYLTLRPESVHQVMFLFSDRGIPDGHRHQHGYGSNTFSLIGKDMKLTWCKFIYKTDQGIKNLDPDKAEEIAGKDPDYALRDLYNAIAKGECPTWTLYIQVMTPEQAENIKTFNPFDITKVWPHEQFPLQPVGKIVLNRNSTNYFAEVEQLAFTPSNMPPGIGSSPDRLLQGRLFAYQDAHLYRLGVNFEQLEVNSIEKKKYMYTQVTSGKRVRNFQRDGLDVIYDQNGAPNYHPNSFGGPDANPSAKNGVAPPQLIKETLMKNYDLGDDDNYSQPQVFWNKVLDEGAKSRLVKNLASTLKLTSKTIRDRAVDMFGNIHKDLKDGLKLELKEMSVVHL